MYRARRPRSAVASPHADADVDVAEPRAIIDGGAEATR